MRTDGEAISGICSVLYAQGAGVRWWKSILTLSLIMEP